MVKNPIPNVNNFFASSIAGQTEITHHTFIKLFHENSKGLKFFILPSLRTFHAILGNDSLKELSAVIHTADDYMIVDNKIKLRIKQLTSHSVNVIDIRNDHMTEQQKLKLDGIVQRHRNLFSEPNEKLTYTTSVIGEIQTKDENAVYSRYYPYPMHLKDEVESQIKELLDHGIIRPSRSPYNSPIWIVPKKTDASGKKKYRMVIDYRKLNDVTIADKYPIPNINDVLPQLAKCKWFSVIDLKSGFHQIPLKESDMKKQHSLLTMVNMNLPDSRLG